MAKLVLFLADGSTLDILLSRERVTIGRRPDNDVCLPYPAVSGEHAAVVTILSDSFLEDLNSTNGTLVNGKTIAKHFLRDRDEIDVGRQKLLYLVDDDVVLDPSEKAFGRDDVALFGERVQPAKSPVADDSRRAPNGKDSARERAAAKKGSDGRGRAGETESMAEIDRFVAAEVAAASGSNDAAPGGAAEPAMAPGAPPGRYSMIRVLSGPSAGRELALEKRETVVGRVGVQVAALRRVDGELRLVLLEGASAPTVNNEPIAVEGRSVLPGDILEIAGVRLEIVKAAEP
jgi:hypothetical protein